MQAFVCRFQNDSILGERTEIHSQDAPMVLKGDTAATVLWLW